MTALEKELVETLEACVAADLIPAVTSLPKAETAAGNAARRVADVLARAKQTGTHEFTVTDDGHGRAMVGGKRLAYGGMGLEIGDKVNTSDTWGVGLPVSVGTRVRVELRDGCDFAALVEVLP